MDPGAATVADLAAAVRAEDRQVVLAGAIRRFRDENVVLETDAWIYCFPKNGIDFDREIRLLDALHGRLPVARPRVEWVGTKSCFCAYRKIAGWRFDRAVCRTADRSRQRGPARSLAEYLAAIHQVSSRRTKLRLGIPGFFSLAQRAGLIRLDAGPNRGRTTDRAGPSDQ